MSKGSWTRPRQISREEYDLRYDLMFGKITSAEFEVGMEKLRKAGKLKRPWAKMR